MSVYVTGHIWKHSQSTLGARLVMLYLADCAHEDGSNIYPSVATIATATRLSERQVQRQIRCLLESGELLDVGRSPLGTRQFHIPLMPEMSPRQIVTPDIRDIGGVTNQAENDVRNVTRSVIRDPYKKPVSASRSIVPSDFTLNEADRLFATGRGMPMSEIADEFEKFRNYHESKGNRFKDWHKAWRTWAMNYRPTTRAPVARSESRYQGSQSGVADLPPDVLKRFEVR